MRPKFEEVLLLCPEVATGGPEALHQLAFCITQQGGNAKLAYSGPYSRVSIDNDILRCDSTKSPMSEHFAQYQPQVLRETHLGLGTLIVYPEVMIDLATVPPIANSHRAIWWLSVDNATAKDPRLLDESYRRTLFANFDFLHFHQSEYAHIFLKKSGTPNCFPLSDYTDPQMINRGLSASVSPSIARRANNICFFPNKGAALAKQFIASGALRNPISLLPIHNMTKAQVRDTLFAAKIYIDFGHHPGKDRVPREAAAAGAIVLLHAAGAANCSADHPLAPEHRFTEADIVSGQLHKFVDEILDNPEEHFNAQRTYRDAVSHERERFDQEVRSIFFS